MTKLEKAMHNYLQIENAKMVFNTKKGKFTALHRHQPERAEGRVHRADRPFRLRQIDPAQPGRRPDRCDRTACCCSTTARSKGPGPDRGVVFQNHSLLPWLTCFGNVHLAVERVFGAKESKKELKERTEAALDLVALWRTPCTSIRAKSPAA
jgi:nitrate/nitrite transport system ATP-binding protein